MPATVREGTLDDLDEVLAIRAEVAAEGIWIATEAPIDLEGDRVKFAKTITDAAAGLPLLFLVADLDGAVVGSLGLLSDGSGLAHLGMNVDGRHRGQGIGSALLAAAVDWARARPEVHKIDLEHWPWNHAGHALYERHGFVEEGYRRRQYRRRSGALWDTVLMGLVLDEDAPGHEERADQPPR